MKKKIFRSIIAVAMVVLAASFFIASSFLYSYFNKSQINRLQEELSLAAAGVDKLGTGYFDSYNSSVFRFTLVSDDGSVLYDSQADEQQMENHLDREEISGALANGSGSSARYSATLTEKTLYEAVRLQNGSVLRISVSQATVASLVLSMLPAACVIVLISVAVALVLSGKMAKSIVQPLDRLDLENPAENDVYEELAPVLTKINKQHKQIAHQMQEIKRKADEFEQITASMSEGLVLLDNKGVVLSINAAAKQLFGTDDGSVGRDFFTVDRSTEMCRAVETALGGGHGELQREKNGREYRFIVNSTRSGGNAVGVVILCLDVTDAAFAERNRREFTANVSHELKTPLQSIIGSAELLESGLVKPEDTARFVGNIKNEASRLVLLINDIIRLSQLDEGSAPAAETVDLYDVACEVVDDLAGTAAKKQVKILLTGGHCTVSGVRGYIYEIIYNLCDNAIRYNKEGGRAEIEIKKDGGHAYITVSDTGIGIPAEHRARIFERFYRVDKSHSKETGGTGLGLSIVKHAVAFHGGTINLESTEGKGTAVTVVL